MLKNILINSLKTGELSEDADVEKCSNYLLGVMQGLSIVGRSMSEKQVEDYLTIALKNLE